ncbi:response regulator [Uliginosibacterium gangwonense]|uniref:response regulator n=1 Tax=Uliginosibacterium gangwonense TaxID=392736 RepID=UPI00037FC206|nr:response regulator [Uliginosibacterium gangwonense]
MAAEIDFNDPHPGYPSLSLILIVEDEQEILDILSAYVERSGLRSIQAKDGRKALELHLSHAPDLVLLDVQLPQIDGWRVLSEIRHRGETPVIMLTAMDQDVDKLMGLRTGADDYIVKPFNPAEVVARIQAVLRRSGNNKYSDGKIVRVSDFLINLETYEVNVCVKEEKVALSVTLTEFKLLVYLARNPRRVVSRSELLEACLPESDALERTVDSHIYKLRKKIEATGIADVLVSVRGVGYRLLGAE